jgi:hypothetical protein
MREAYDCYVLTRTHTREWWVSSCMSAPEGRTSSVPPTTPPVAFWVIYGCEGMQPLPTFDCDVRGQVWQRQLTDLTT